MSCDIFETDEKVEFLNAYGGTMIASRNKGVVWKD